MDQFRRHLQDHHVRFERKLIDTLQLNVTKKCNMACQHCHVDSSPARTEKMSDELVHDLYALVDCYPSVKTVDLTGGAPELHPRFRDMVVEFRRKGLNVLDRCNLTILFEPGFEDLAAFLAEQHVEIAASLPCYTEDNVDKQRGMGAYEKSIRGIRLLNSLGYGVPGSDLILNLVYNPVGAYLPGNQSDLERDYHRELRERHDLQFNKLFTITNMPIKRFANYLHARKEYDAYMQLLIDHFNPAAAAGVMCMNLISISHDGRVFDCDFNQMLEIGLAGKKLYVKDLLKNPDLIYDKIATGEHCFGCTAGNGSGCYGSVV